MKIEFKGIFFICIFLAALSKIAIGADDTMTLSEQRYVDPKGYFAVIPPAGWRVQDYPQEDRGKVAFLSPTNNVELRVLVAAVDFNTIEELISGATDLEKRIGKSSNIEKTIFYGRPAIKRSLEMNGTRLLVYDFLIGNTHHNLQFGAPPSQFTNFNSIVEKSMATYEPTNQGGTSKEILEHTLAGKRRIAQLAIESGNMELAAEYVEEGLRISPSDIELNKLDVDIDRSNKSSTQIVTPVTMPQDDIAKERDQPKESNPSDVYIAAVVGSLVVLGFMIVGIEKLRINEGGIYPLALTFGAPAFGLAAIGEGVKAGHYVPIAVAVALFISGLAIWFFRFRK